MIELSVNRFRANLKAFVDKAIAELLAMADDLIIRKMRRDGDDERRNNLYDLKLFLCLNLTTIILFKKKHKVIL